MDISNFSKSMGFPRTSWGPRAPGFIKALFVVTASDDDHPTGIFALAELPEHLHSVHTGHEQVEKDQIRRRLFYHREGLETIFYAECPIPTKAEKLNEQVADQRLIVDNEDRFPRIGHGCTTRHRRSGNGFIRKLHHSIHTFDQYIE